MTQADAFAAGQATGSRAANTSVFNNINAATGAAKIDGYSSTPAESSYWGVNSPITPVMTAGAGKITSCSGAPSSDPRIANQCEAINALNEQPSKRPPGLVTPTDPLIVSGDAITANPEAIAGSLTGAYSACTTNEVSLGKETVEETCDEYASPGTSEKCIVGTKVTVDPDHLYKCKDSQHVEANSSCTIGRVVEVDADANYQCTTTEKVHQQLTCKKTAMVTVDYVNMGGCTPGQQWWWVWVTGFDTTDAWRLTCQGNGTFYVEHFMVWFRQYQAPSIVRSSKHSIQQQPIPAQVLGIAHTHLRITK